MWLKHCSALPGPQTDLQFVDALLNLNLGSFQPLPQLLVVGGRNRHELHATLLQVCDLQHKVRASWWVHVSAGPIASSAPLTALHMLLEQQRHCKLRALSLQMPAAGLEQDPMQHGRQGDSQHQRPTLLILHLFLLYTVTRCQATRTNLVLAVEVGRNVNSFWEKSLYGHTRGLLHSWKRRNMF